MPKQDEGSSAQPHSVCNLTINAALNA